MADPYLSAPLVGDQLGLPSEGLQRPERRDDLLDYYLGPTGVPERLGAANELLNPIRGISDAMYYAGEAAAPGLSASERLGLAGRSAMEAGIAALPVGLAKVAGRYSRALPGGQADDAQAVVETMTGATPDLQDPSRRRFMAGMGAAAVAPMLPAEELLATATRASTRGAGSSVLGNLLAKKAQRAADYTALSDQLTPLDRVIASAGRYEDLPPVLMTEEAAQKVQEARNAMEQRKSIVGDLRGVREDISGIDDEITEALLEMDDLGSFLGSLDDSARERLASDTLDTLAKRVSEKQGAMGIFDFQTDIFDALRKEDTAALEELGLTKPEVDLAAKLWPSLQERLSGYE